MASVDLDLTDPTGQGADPRDLRALRVTPPPSLAARTALPGPMVLTIATEDPVSTRTLMLLLHARESLIATRALAGKKIMIVVVILASL
jgi:hypothetical protein